MSRPPATRDLTWKAVAGTPVAVPALLHGQIGLMPAVAMAVVLVIAMRHVAKRRQMPTQALGFTLCGIALVTVVLAMTGSARSYYMPSIVVSTLWALLLVLSAAVRRPIIGYAFARLDRRFLGWEREEPSMHVFRVLTAAWGVGLGVRIACQWWLYLDDRIEWLVAFRLVTTPLIIGLTAATIVAARRAQPMRPVGVGMDASQ